MVKRASVSYQDPNTSIAYEQQHLVGNRTPTVRRTC